MSLTDYFLYFVGIPALLVTLISLKVWSRKGAHPATYQMSEKWTHPPILWAAVDEAIGGQHGHGQAEFSVGGGSSGKW